MSRNSTIPLGALAMMGISALSLHQCQASSEARSPVGSSPPAPDARATSLQRTWPLLARLLGRPGPRVAP